MSLLSENTKRWNRMKVKPSFMQAGRAFAQRALKHKAVYLEIASEIKARYHQHIPWWALPLVHERECTRGVDNFTCNIAQGAPYNVKSKIIPHSGPFASFKEAAIDAVVVQAPRLALNSNWSGGGVMTIDEKYNGLGYAKRGRASPYIWSGTTEYVKGKYVADGKYDANFVDTQVGVAVSLKALMEADPTVALDNDVEGQDQADHSKVIATSSVGTGGVAESAHQAFLSGVDPWIIGALVVVAIAAVAFAAWKFYKWEKGRV